MNDANAKDSAADDAAQADRQATLSFVRNTSSTLLIAAGMLLPLILFGMLAAEVAASEAIWFDHPLQMFLRAHANVLLDECMSWVTLAGSRFIMVPFDLLLLVWLVMRERRWEALFWTVSVTGSAVINWVAKQLFARMRPGLWEPGLHEAGYSFPSGHTMSAMAAMTALCILVWPTRWRWAVTPAAAFFVALVALSRVYLGAHYPSDVLAGVMASLAWVTGLALLMERIPGRRIAA